MGRVLIMISLCILYGASCKSPNDEKAKGLIYDYLKKSIPNPTTYKSLSFTKLDSSFENLSQNTKVASPKRFTGFKMTHEFRYVDIFDSLDTMRRTFFFNENIDSIVATRDTIK